MNRLLRAFWRESEGAVTVDWVVLTAAMVGFCIAVYTAMENSTLALRDGVADAIEVENDFGAAE